MVDKYYLIGHPITHSLSPAIHNYFAKIKNQNMVYRPLEIQPNNFEEVIARLLSDKSVKGLSVTMPYKKKFYDYCDKLDDSAKKVQSISNVVINDKRELVGYNIDGICFIQDVKKNLKFNLFNKSVLIIGAGNTARSIFYSLIAERPKKIAIANRTLNKSYEIFDDINTQDIALNTFDFHNIDNTAYDLIINATSISTEKIIIPVSKKNFHFTSLAYDINYFFSGTTFTNWCRKQHILNSDGSGMILEISKMAFNLWRGSLI